MSRWVDRDKIVPRILVVDDEYDVAKSIEAVLRRKYQVAIVHSGISAIQEARRHRPDLIVLDVFMPGQDGIETCEQIRKDPTLADIPILVLTALSSDQEKIAGLRAGADDYMTKPFNSEELRLRIEAILRRVAPRDSKPPDRHIQLDNLVLDRQNYEVSTGQKRAVLTPIEFELMHHLMTHAEEVFNSERLLQEVWDYPAESGSPDLVRMHIKKLREKIEIDPRHPTVIVTIPRRGYTIRKN